MRPYVGQIIYICSYKFQRESVSPPQIKHGQISYLYGLITNFILYCPWGKALYAEIQNKP